MILLYMGYANLSGPHHISVEVNGHELDDTPFICNVFDPEQVRLTRLGPIFVNKPAKFESMKNKHTYSGT